MFLVLLLGACASPPATPGEGEAREAYIPGLGEIMSLQQMRHTKLWLAGSAENWALASYELDELEEGFDDVVTFHPTEEGAPVSPEDMIPNLVEEPLDSLRTAVERQDETAFAAGFDALTLACNDCHEAMQFSFNRVQRPASNPYPNQVFAPGS